MALHGTEGERSSIESDISSCAYRFKCLELPAILGSHDIWCSSNRMLQCMTIIFLTAIPLVKERLFSVCQEPDHCELSLSVFLKSALTPIYPS